MRVVRVTYSKREDHLMMILPFGREEVTRTPDPHVPNVVRYQLRYFSFFRDPKKLGVPQ